MHLFSEMQRHGPQPNLITYNATGLLLAEVLTDKDSDCIDGRVCNLNANFRGGSRRLCQLFFLEMTRILVEGLPIGSLAGQFLLKDRWVLIRSTLRFEQCSGQ